MCTQTTTALIVDDEADMRLLVRLHLEAAPAPVVIDVIAEASDGTEALRLFGVLGKERLPDVVVLDNRMPGITGLEVARCVLAAAPGQRIVLFSADLTPRIVEEARRIGIRRCVGKDHLDRLAHAVIDVVAHDT